MLQDKTMVSDALAMMNTSLTTYAAAIAQCANPTLRASFQQIRNGDEASQYELFKMAWSKGYYKPAVQASDQDVQQVKTWLQG